EVEANRRLRVRIGRLDVDRPEAFRPQLVAGDGHAGEILQLALLRILDGIGDQVQLDVRRGELGARLQECDQRRRRQCQKAAAPAPRVVYVLASATRRARRPCCLENPLPCPPRLWMPTLMWSRKFSPTAGSACFTSMPCFCSTSGLPMPESSSTCGLAIPPAQ